MDREKFKTLVHYICWKCDDPSKLGATKLNKIIWFAERSWFLKTGEAISGVKFVKQERGPVPNAILPVLDSLVEEHRLVNAFARVFACAGAVRKSPKFSNISTKDLPDRSVRFCSKRTICEKWVWERGVKSKEEVGSFDRGLNCAPNMFRFKNLFGFLFCFRSVYASYRPLSPLHSTR